MFANDKELIDESIISRIQELSGYEPWSFQVHRHNLEDEEVGIITVAVWRGGYIIISKGSELQYFQTPEIQHSTIINANFEKGILFKTKVLVGVGTGFAIYKNMYWYLFEAYGKLNLRHVLNITDLEYVSGWGFGEQSIKSNVNFIDDYSKVEMLLHYSFKSEDADEESKPEEIEFKYTYNWDPNTNLFYSEGDIIRLLSLEHHFV